MPVRELLYEAALLAARPALRLAAPVHPKLRRGLAGRRLALETLEAWAAAARDPARPLVWLHASSAGETLMAQAIIGALRDRRADLQVAFTFFSSSAERLAGRVGADVHAYLPWDTRRAARRALGSLRPQAVAFVRGDVWPILAREASAAGARLALVNAVLPAGSSRLRASSRYFLGPAYARLQAVGAVTGEHARRFAALGVAEERTRVTGDARFDQVWARTRSAGREPSLSFGRLEQPPATVVVAGSTWPSDETRLLPAFALVRVACPCRLIIAPHEPSETSLRRLERRLDREALAHARLSRIESREGPAPEVVVVDRLGVLADLYRVADIAYVGGGFHRPGVHSVVEPAALAIPVLVGPRHENAREAAELAAAGGGIVVADAEALAARLLALARDPAARGEAGAAAAAYVRRQLGAAARNAELILELLERR